MRNPALQHQNRVRKLSEKLIAAQADVRYYNHLIIEAEKKLAELRAKRAGAMKTRSMWAKHHAKILYLTDMNERGLPLGMDHVQWKALTGEDIEHS